MKRRLGLVYQKRRKLIYIKNKILNHIYKVDPTHNPGKSIASKLALVCNKYIKTFSNTYKT